MKPKLIFIIFFVTFWCNTVHGDVARENKIKAAYLFHIINFVQWPAASRNSGSNTRIQVCLMGNTAFMSSLIPLSRQSVSKFHLDIKPIYSPPTGNSCDIIYFANTLPEETKKSLAAVCHRPILTLGDTPGFAQFGGIIGFVNHHDNVRLEINLSSAKHAGFSISAKLLEVALNIINDQKYPCE